MSPQESFKVEEGGRRRESARGEFGGECRGARPLLWRWRQGPCAKGCRRPLADGSTRKWVSPRGLQKGAQPPRRFDCSLVGPLLSSGSRRCIRVVLNDRDCGQCPQRQQDTNACGCLKESPPVQALWPRNTPSLSSKWPQERRLSWRAPLAFLTDVTQEGPGSVPWKGADSS